MSRLYSITNMYTSGIHAGIQTAHAVHELFTKYSETPERAYEPQKVLYDWAVNHKTIIVLNGGYHSHLEDYYAQVHELSKHLRLPCAKFYESREALNGALTVVVVVVPEWIYSMAEPEGIVLVGGRSLPHPYSNELKLKNLLDSLSLAR